MKLLMMQQQQVYKGDLAAGLVLEVPSLTTLHARHIYRVVATKLYLHARIKLYICTLTTDNLAVDCTINTSTQIGLVGYQD